MSNNHRSETFHPNSPDAAEIVSWVHIGDLHMTRTGQQNDIDLQAIVSDLDEVFLDSVSFVYLPGDVADDGSYPSDLKVGREALTDLVKLGHNSARTKMGESGR
jgi:hypothetical protein